MMFCSVHKKGHNIINKYSITIRIKASIICKIEIVVTETATICDFETQLYCFINKQKS